MNGITGFNPQLVRSQLVTFANAATDINLEIGTAYRNFISELKFYWASPVAKEFSRTSSLKFENLSIRFGELAQDAVSGAVAAYNSAASVNHMPPMQDIENDPENGNILYQVGFDCEDLLEIKDGNVGMNINEVRDVILPNFKKEIATLLDEIANLPSTIALYDDENGQQHSYDMHIDAIRRIVSDNANEIIGEVERDLTTETENLLLYKKQSEELLKGNVTE